MAAVASCGLNEGVVNNAGGPASGDDHVQQQLADYSLFRGHGGLAHLGR